jgi:ribosomal protein S18 acetylase RimI-like enzyme
MNNDQVKVVEADLTRTDHQEATVQLLNGYAMDPMGNGKPIPESVKQMLIPGLRQHPTTMVFLAHQADKPVGIAACFLGFSTFAARPLINIHDYFVSPACRGMGVGRLLLSTVEKRARELGCCKLTLEVQENNHRAKRIYAAAGFSQAVYASDAGGSLFLTRPL